MKKVSKKQFLEELGSVWNESPARSILLARLDYEHIPAETAGIGQAMGSQFRTQQSINESVSLSSVKKITQAMALFIAEWCGTEGITP